MYQDAVRAVIESRKASTSLLQRRLRIGYGRAARLIETMEEQESLATLTAIAPVKSWFPRLMKCLAVLRLELSQKTSMTKLLTKLQLATNFMISVLFWY